MSTSSIFVGNRTIRKIFNQSCSSSIDELKKHIKFKLIIPEMYSSARLDFDVNVGIPAGNYNECFENPDFFPLKFFTVDGTEELWISGIRTGCHGPAPLGTIDALKLMGFTLTKNQENEIITSKHVHVIYRK